MEEWRDVPGFTGLYQVSSEGQVRSLDRVVEQTGHSTQGLFARRYRGKLLVGSSAGGYSLLNLFRGGKSYSMTRHRLVALAFIPNPEGKPEIDHINRNILDNRACNLRWATKREQALNRKSSAPHAYIYERNNHWRIKIERLGYSATFNTLPEAIEARDNLLG
jgi:hypothetical protein